MHDKLPIKHCFPDSSKSWTAHKVEMTLWTHYMANKLDPNLLSKQQKGTTSKRKSTDNDGDATKRVKSTRQNASSLALL